MVAAAVVAVLAVVASLLVILLDNADHHDDDAASSACPAGYYRLQGADPDADSQGGGDADADAPDADAPDADAPDADAPDADAPDADAPDADAPDADAPDADSDADHDSDADKDGDDGDADKDADKDAAQGPCWKDGAPLPEQLQDLTSTNSSMSGIEGFNAPASMQLAERQAAALGKVSIPNAGGRWQRVSNGLLNETDPHYVAGGYGNTVLSGRMSGYAIGPNGVVYGGVANGGVWKSTDQGQHWKDISLHLPSQIVGAIGWTRAGGPKGTLMALTGDNSFGQYNWSGSGLFWTTDEGAHWHLAKGIPGGLLAFKIAVAPDTPSVVYAGTGGGLYRSTDGGRHFVNVKLPTVAGCWKHPFIEKCALSNDVTDVVVRGKDKYGHTGGAVVAAVGWRAGNQKNADGTEQAPANGLYESATGKVGSFTKLPDSSGFAPSGHVGRVSLGDAYGPAQNHDYLYALVQDSVLLQKGGVELVPDQLGNGVTSNKIVTYVNGAYVSKDFGKTWTKMEGTTGFISPTTGSSLAALEPLGEAPGVQAWYNNWIQPDPYEQLGGVPTNVMLGMEEIWQSATAGTPQTGPTSFQVVAPYAGGTYVCVIVGSACSLTLQKTGVTSAHPDQHGILFLPPKNGVSKILATSDGGNYSATMPLAGLLKQTDFKAAQSGFNTLIPYSFDVSHNGTIADGMQDNGSLIWHPGDPIANETYPGDGGTTLIDPKHPNQLIASLAIGAELVVNTLGGQGTSILNDDDITPDVGTRYTYGLLARDLAHPNLIMYGGRKIDVADAPIAKLSTSSWKQVYDLGTRKQPGVASAKASLNNPDLEDTANDLYKYTAYVGWCGACQTITGTGTIGTGGSTFASGIATNFGGKWHMAKAKGLPHRLINSVLVDHQHQGTVYVGLGVSTKRQAFNPGATGHDGVSKGGGFVYESTNGGKTFHDITGNLPKVGVLSLAQYRGQLVVGSTLGAYMGAKGKPRYGRLGQGLPAIAISQMKFRPGYPKQLYVSTWGRGIYRINLNPLPDPAVSNLRVTHTGGKLVIKVQLSNRSAQNARIVDVRVRQNGKYLRRVVVPRLKGETSQVLTFTAPYHHLRSRTITVSVVPGQHKHELSKKNNTVTKKVKF